MHKLINSLWLATVVGVIVMLTLVFSNAQAATVIDPRVTPSKTLTCDYPTQRTDGTTITVSEIQRIDFYVSNDAGATWSPAGSNNAACSQVYDMTQIVNGDYQYAARTVDTGDRESVMSVASDVTVLWSLTEPEAPTNLQWQ